MSTSLSRHREGAPAIAPSTPVTTADTPRWIRLNQLPGFLWGAIRAMGESVFSPLTRTRLERIEVIADLEGQGPNKRQEIDATAQWLRSSSAASNIVEYSSTEVAQLFGRNTYRAKAIQFETVEFTYLMVQDAMGCYIYRWPTSDTLRRSARVQNVNVFLTDKKTNRFL